MASPGFEASVIAELRVIRETGARLEQRLQEMARLPQVCPSPSLAASGGAQSQRPDGAAELGVSSGSYPGIPSATRRAQSFRCITDDFDLNSVPHDFSRLRSPDWASTPVDLGKLRSPDEGLLGVAPQRSLRSGTMSMSDGSVSYAPNPLHAKDFVASSLPLGWPTVLSVRTELCSDVHVARSQTSAYRLHSLRTSLNEAFDRSQIDVGRFGIDPNSRFHMSYSALSLAILVWDLTLLPYVLAWDVQFSGALYFSAWFTPLFWTGDIGINFCTGFYRDGEIIKNARQIARNYFKTWFFPDLIVVLCDWMSIILGETLDAADDSRSLKMLRFTKLGRLLRIAGMMRMLRVVRIIEEFAEVHLSEGYRLVFRLLSLFTAILWVTHLLACLWFVVGTSAPSDTGYRWIDFKGFDVEPGGMDFMHLAGFYQYMVSFHWAAGQIALGSLDVNPTNSWERVVFVLAMMFGFLFGSTLISMLSAAMMDYQMMQKDRTMRLRTLRQYIRENEVHPTIAVRVQKQVEQRLAHRERIDENDVSALQLLSVALRSHMRFEIQRPSLTRHPLFRLWASLDMKLMHRSCMKAVSFLNLRPKDDLFTPGPSTGCAFTLDRGDMAYTQYPDSSPVGSEEATFVASGQWMCEASLWVVWTHVGKAEATTTCQLLSIKGDALSQSLSEDMILKDIGREYCVQFHKRVTTACPPHSPWPTDLHVPFTDYCDLVVAMSKQVQVAIGREALGQLVVQRGARSIDKLADEVDVAKSIVVVTETGAIIRVVALVVLRCEDEEGRVLMQVGKWNGEAVQRAFQLPGVKQERDELLGDTLERILDTRLRFLRNNIQFMGIVREIEEKDSKEYGVHTRYLRSICTAQLLDGAVVEACVCTWQPSSSAGDELSEDFVGRRRSFDAQQRQNLREVYKSEVYAVPMEDKTAPLFAWLPKDTVALLQTPAGDKVLHAWLSGLAVPRVEPPEEDASDAGDAGDSEFSSFGV